ncbi:hypothetical protein [Pseudomonas nicosulfuronedens]
MSKKFERLWLSRIQPQLHGYVITFIDIAEWLGNMKNIGIINDCGHLASSLAYNFNARGLLVDADVERLRPRIDRWDQGPVQSRLYDIIDSNCDGKLAADEIQTALGIPAKAQSIAQLAIEYESEWHYRQAKWDDLDEVLGHTPSTPLLNWMAEKERIRELKWWSDVAGRVGLPEGAGLSLASCWVGGLCQSRINWLLRYLN